MSLFSARFMALVGLCVTAQFMGTVAILSGLPHVAAIPGSHDMLVALLSTTLTCGGLWCLGMAGLVLATAGRRRGMQSVVPVSSSLPGSADDDLVRPFSPVSSPKGGVRGGGGGRIWTSNPVAASWPPASPTGGGSWPPASPTGSSWPPTSPTGSAHLSDPEQQQQQQQLQRRMSAALVGWWPDEARHSPLAQRAALFVGSLLCAVPVVGGMVVPPVFVWDLIIGRRVHGCAPALMPGMPSLRLAVVLSYVQAVLQFFPAFAIACAAHVHCAHQACDPAANGSVAFVLATALVSVLAAVAVWAAHKLEEYRLFSFTGRPELRRPQTGPTGV